jgi:hypothetical protein
MLVLSLPSMRRFRMVASVRGVRVVALSVMPAPVSLLRTGESKCSVRTCANTLGEKSCTVRRTL